MVIVKYDHTNQIADLYYVADDVAVNEGDVMVLTGNNKTGDPAGTVYEVAPFTNSYKTTDVVGIALTAMASDYPNRDDITILHHGVVEVMSGGAGSTINKLQVGVEGEAAVEDAASGDWCPGRALTTAPSGSKMYLEVNFQQF